MAKRKAPKQIDYDTFLPRLVEGLRKAWQEVHSERPEETFYMYGIGTDSDVVVMTPFCATEEQYVIDGDPDFLVDKWSIQEALYGAGSKHTSALESEVNRYIFEDYSQESKGAFEKRKKRLLEIFEQALVQLDQEGFFGKGRKRHQVLLKIDRGDCSEEEFNEMLEVIKRINPPQSTKRYLALLHAVKQKKEIKNSLEEKITILATEYLVLEKRPFDRWLSTYRVNNPSIIPYLAKLLQLQKTPKELWQVCFESKNEPGGQMHGPGVIGC